MKDANVFIATLAAAPGTSRRAMASLAVALALAVPGLAGCTPQEQEAEAKGSSTSTAQAKPVMLAITGYNYTNRHISSFSVNGQGGGNLFVSTATSGGGGSACCVLYKPGAQVRKIIVRWQADACQYRKKSSISSETYDIWHPIFKEREITVDPVIPPDPKVLEVHFYPDGSIQAAITAGGSSPRLRLNASREDKSDYPRCTNDAKPAE